MGVLRRQIIRRYASLARKYILASEGLATKNVLSIIITFPAVAGMI